MLSHVPIAVRNSVLIVKHYGEVICGTCLTCGSQFSLIHSDLMASPRPEPPRIQRFKLPTNPFASQHLGGFALNPFFPEGRKVSMKQCVRPTGPRLKSSTPDCQRSMKENKTQHTEKQMLCQGQVGANQVPDMKSGEALLTRVRAWIDVEKLARLNFRQLHLFVHFPKSVLLHP